MLDSYLLIFVCVQENVRVTIIELAIVILRPVCHLLLVEEHQMYNTAHNKLLFTSACE